MVVAWGNGGLITGHDAISLSWRPNTAFVKSSVVSTSWARWPGLVVSRPRPGEQTSSDEEPAVYPQFTSTTFSHDAPAKTIQPMV